MKIDNLTYSFLRLQEKLHRSALRLLGNEEDAKDALQDTFLNLWKKGPVDSDNEASNKLFKVLRNVCIDRLRKPPTSSIEDFHQESLPVIPDFSEDMDRLEQLLYAGLTEIQMRIYTLVAKDGIEYSTIASELGIKVEAVRMNMSRARKKIKENYQKLNR
ncbi:MAG: RNA polymerase sigma factor [Muribaculaceae bacterium]|nr:RNA polymerase sigma factor [Muribaculaceae bacterium]